MNTSLKLLLSSLIILAANGIAGLIIYKHNQKVISSQLWVQHTENIIDKSKNIKSLIKEIETSSRGYVITMDPAFLEPLLNIQNKVDAQINQIRIFTQDNALMQKQIDSLEFYVQKRLDFANKMIDLQDRDGSASSSAFVATKLGMFYTDKVSQITEAIIAVETLLLVQRKELSERSLTIFNLFLVVMLLLMAIFTIILLLIATRDNLFQNREKQKQAALLAKLSEDRRETNEYLENLLNYANALIIVWDAHNNITRFNRAFEAITGRREEELIGKTVEVLFPPASSGVSMEIINRTTNGVRLEVTEIDIVHIDGTICTLQWNSANILSPDGNSIVATIAQGHDITKRKLAEEEIRLLTETLELKVIQRTSLLEAANKELEAFSYSVSHDLRAPLRHIGGYVDLLKKNNSMSPDESSVRFMNIISESAREMGNLIDALLTFSRLGRTEFFRTRIKSKIQVSRVLETFNEDLTGRNIVISVSDLPDIMGDEKLISQVWINLISNALKYSRNEEKAIIEIGSKTETDRVVFHITDNGVGFDMQYADKLFGVFQQLHKARDFEGIGIGLANVNRIVMRHGGTCRAESEPGKGATFYFSIPKNNLNHLQS